jgi:DNA excision repair protein ERCC-6-like
MNNLKELHALFNFATSGKVLGTHKEFHEAYVKPIEAARSADAEEWEITAGEQAMIALQRKINPYFLQRLKKDHLTDKLPKKREYVLWTNLSPVQRQKYSEYVQSKDSAIADYFSGVVTSPLFAISWLQKLCGHPLLAATDDSTLPEDDDPDDEKPTKPSRELANYDPKELMRDSAKLQVLHDLMDFLKSKGHRTLIFSQYTKVLDIIHCVLKDRFTLSRIDWKTKEKDRQRFVDEFNRKDSQFDAMLVSTKAGGVGLTLVGADTCIVYDPSWNPAEDAQAVDRAYRISQDKEVTVYRLIAAGTVEEKRYEKQIHKDGIRRAVFTNTGNDTAKYFTKQELIHRKVFVLGEEGECEFLDKLAQRGLAFDPNEIPSHNFSFHNGVVGQSSHDIVYSCTDWNGETKKGGAPTAHPFSSPTKTAKWLAAEKPAPKPSIPSPSIPSKKQTLGKAQRVLAQNRHQARTESHEKENSVIGDPNAEVQPAGRPRLVRSRRKGT